MPKKIIFSTFLALSISNNIQTMFFPFLVGLVNEQNGQNDENSCCSCLRIYTAVFFAMFQSDENQQTPILDAQQCDLRRFASSMDNQWFMNQNKKNE